MKINSIETKTLYSSLSLKNAFSVIPMRAVALASMKMVSPKKMWIGRKKDRRWEARPGQRKVTRPRHHWAMAMEIVRMPAQECRLYEWGMGGWARLWLSKAAFMPKQARIVAQAITEDK